MTNHKFILYINGQSTKPLVNSLSQAMRHAEAHLKFRPSLRIECFRSPIVACVWNYDHKTNAWNKSVCRESELCCSAMRCEVK
jgi:hypothetical protein